MRTVIGRAMPDAVAGISGLASVVWQVILEGALLLWHEMRHEKARAASSQAAVAGLQTWCYGVMTGICNFDEVDLSVGRLLKGRLRGGSVCCVDFLSWHVRSHSLCLGGRKQGHVRLFQLSSVGTAIMLPTSLTSDTHPSQLQQA